jgi:hypothetical protein
MNCIVNELKEYIKKDNMYERKSEGIIKTGGIEQLAIDLNEFEGYEQEKDIMMNAMMHLQFEEQLKQFVKDAKKLRLETSGKPQKKSIHIKLIYNDYCTYFQEYKNKIKISDEMTYNSMIGRRGHICMIKKIKTI